MWDSLPPEVLGLVFSYCDMETVRRAEGVCQGWSRAVVATAWRKTILKWCRRDEHAAEWVREWRRAHGESYQSERLLYGRLVEGAWERGWRQGWAQRRARPDAVIHMCYVGEAFEEFKVSDAACRGGSLFLARRSGAVERWRLGEGGKEKEVVDVESREVIAHGGDYKNPDVKAGMFKLSLCGPILAFFPSTRERIVTYDVDKRKTVATFVLPPREGGQGINVRNTRGAIYDLKLTSRNAVCLCLWSIVVFDLKDPSKKPAVLLDGCPTPRQCSWLESHKLEANDDFVVTLATNRDAKASAVRARRLADVVSPPAASTSESFSSSSVPNSVLCLEEKLGKRGAEYLSIKLSESGFLAIFRVLHDNRTSVDVYHLSSSSGSTRVASFCRGNFLSLTHLPEAWMGDRLFLKVVPDPGSEEAKVSLAYWDCSFNRGGDSPLEPVPVEGLAMASQNDLLCLGMTRLVHLYHTFPERSPSPEEDDGNSPSSESPAWPSKPFRIKCSVLDYLGPCLCPS